MSRKTFGVPEASEAEINGAIVQILAADGWRIVMMETVSDHERKRFFGEPGMADILALRYITSDILWIEGKKKKGRVAQHQRDWHEEERRRGARTIIAKEDFEASVDGFWAWYKSSGLLIRKGLQVGPGMVG